MKRTLVAAALAATIVAAPALAGSLSGTVFGDSSQPIAVTKGSDFLIALPSNPTTGYSWTARVAGAAVANEGSAYQAHPAAPGMAGSGGQQIFALEAVTRGTATVTFAYARPFEKGKAPVKTAVFHITVR